MCSYTKINIFHVFMYFSADGITMVGYQRLGSVRYSVRGNGMRDRGRSGSDPLSLSSSAPSVDNILSDCSNKSVFYIFFL